MNALNTPLARAILATLIFAQAVSVLFDVVASLSYRLDFLELLNFLGQFMPGDDYQRFAPLADAVPLWLLCSQAIAGGLFILSIWLLMKRQATVLPVFTLAFALTLVANSIVMRIPIYAEVFSFPSLSLRRDYFIPAAQALLPVLIAAALWQTARWKNSPAL